MVVGFLLRSRRAVLEMSKAVSDGAGAAAWPGQ
jgi:hypothetical protein